MPEFACWLKTRFIIDAENELEAKKILAEALVDWGVSVDDIGAEEE